MTSSLDQFANLDELTLEEVIGTLVAHEEKLHDRLLRREERDLLAKAAAKKEVEPNYSKGRGRGQGW